MKYVFKCNEHGEFEVDQKMSETTKTHSCPTCSKESNKVFLAPNVVVKNPSYRKMRVVKTKDLVKKDKDRWD